MRVVGSILCCSLAVLAATAAPVRAATATCGKLLAPQSGLYLGSMPDFVSDPRQLEGDTVTTGAISQFSSSAGRQPVFVEFDQHWFEGLDFPRAKVMTVWRAGAIPYVRMLSHSGSPYGTGNPPEQFPGDYSDQNIIDGKFDPQLKAWADAARDTNIPILAEWGVEVNNDWGPWAGDWNGAGATTGFGDPSFPDGPERFRAAYRHLVELFRAEGATNVTWFFHVDTWWGPRLPWDTYANYYPGDDVVDWVGFSVYGWQASGPDNTLPTFDQKLQTFHSDSYPGSYADLAAVSTKPIALLETGAPNGTDAERAGWVSGMFDALHSGRYPRIAAMSWWNMADTTTRLDQWPQMQQAFASGAKTQLFDAAPQVSGTCTPAAPRVTIKGRVVRWTTLPNAISYEVWRNGKLVAKPSGTSYTAKVAGKYRVRGLNMFGAGPFG